ncbi:MAG: hypothetical protein ACTHXO_02840 [Actinomycetaceae bacterium]
MSAAVTLWRAGAETPTGELQIWDVSPGIEGFWAFFTLAAAVAVLGFLVMRQMRRVDQNARVRAAQEAAAARPVSDDRADDEPSVHDEPAVDEQPPVDDVPAAEERSARED